MHIFFYSLVGKLTRDWCRDRVVVLCAQRIVHFDFFRELLDGESGQTSAAELLCRRRVYLHVASSRQNLFADVQHPAGYVQVIVRHEVATHFTRSSDAFFQRSACAHSEYIRLVMDHPTTG